MKIDEKAIKFLKAAKAKGMSKEKAMSFLENKGYELGGEPAQPSQPSYLPDNWAEISEEERIAHLQKPEVQDAMAQERKDQYGVKSGLEIAGDVAKGTARKGFEYLPGGTYADEAEAGIRSMASPRSYEQIKSEIGGEKSAFQENVPLGLDIAGNVAGAMMTAPLAAAAGAPKAVSAFAGIPASMAIGAVEGFGAGDDVESRLKSAAFGGATAGIARPLMGAVGKVGGTIGRAGKKALGKVAEDITAPAKAIASLVDDDAYNAVAGKASRDNMSMMEAANEIGGDTARQFNNAISQLTRTAETRGAREATGQYAEEFLSKQKAIPQKVRSAVSDDVFESTSKAADKLKSEAVDFYGKLKGVNLRSKDVDEVLKTPVVAKAIKKISSESGEGFEFDVNSMNALKEQLRKEGQTSVAADKYYRKLNDALKKNSKYSEATRLYKSSKEIEDIVKSGKMTSGGVPEEKLASIYKQANPVEQKALRTKFLDEVKQKVVAKSDDVDSLKTFINEDFRNKAGLFFGKPKAKFMSDLIEKQSEISSLVSRVKKSAEGSQKKLLKFDEKLNKEELVKKGMSFITKPARVLRDEAKLYTRAVQLLSDPAKNKAGIEKIFSRLGVQDWAKVLLSSKTQDIVKKEIQNRKEKR